MQPARIVSSNRRGYTLIKDEIASYVSKSGMDKESN
jgi:hypothetical protein